MLFSSYENTCGRKEKLGVWASGGDMNKSGNIRGSALNSHAYLQEEGMTNIKHHKQMEETSMEK
jgi:hypothetical protein